MKEHQDRYISKAVIRRLPRYFRYLRELLAAGIMRISSSELAERMHVTASQIRQDLNCFGGFGQQGYGYPVDSLIESIGSILHIDQKKSAVIIGVGNLGRAIINNFNFFKNGFQLTAAFDASPEVIGLDISGIHVYDIKDLRDYCMDKHPDVAVLTLPKAYAHDTAALLCDCGIKGIWNFTNIDLHLQFEQVAVENVHFAESLMVLSYRLGEKMGREGQK